MKKTYNQLILILFIMILICPTFSGCGTSDNTPVSDTGFYFDTVVTITLYGTENEKYINKCFELCKNYENLFSRTISSSDISQINSNSKNGVPTVVANDTFYLVQKSIEYSKLSKGKFDITIGALSTLWNFTGENPKIPMEDDIAQTLSTVDYNNIAVDIDNNSIMLTNNNSIMDVGGIAKGYIADKLKDYLLSEGVNNGIINLGGNILLLNEKPDGTRYNIGIQKPFGGKNEVIATVQATDKSIVSSGVYERYFYENNKLYHHILDTDTGYPVENELLGVTIISDLSIDGDALSTTCLALGTEKGLELIESLGDVEAIFVDSGYKLRVSSGLLISDEIIILR